MSEGYKITQFDPSKAKTNCVWLLIGPRNTGKSVLLKDLLYKTRHNYDFGMAMTKTVSTVKMLKEFLPHKLIFTKGYDFEFGERFLITSARLVENGKIRKNVLILDDCMFDNKVMKTKTQKDLHLNGRHYQTSIFNTTQYCMIIPNDIRTNIDYIFALRENINANKKRLFEYFFGLFPSYAAFNKVFTACTANYGCLVIDKTKASSSIKECIFWYVADPEIPKFKIGKSIFFTLSAKVEELEKHQDKSIEQNQMVIN
jgi:hypothetical protein